MVCPTLCESLKLMNFFLLYDVMYCFLHRVIPVVFKDPQGFGHFDSEETKETFCKTCWLLFLVCKGNLFSLLICYTCTCVQVILTSSFLALQLYMYV